MPYVPNYERIDLGLVAYGSDVPQDVLDAAIAARELRGKPPAKKRAPKKAGQFKADDPATPDKDEAWEKE